MKQCQKYSSTTIIRKGYYEILGVDQTATKQQIKQAYYKLVKLHHPDLNGGCDKQFKEIVKAYETLKDPIKKQTYDLGVNDIQYNEDFRDSKYYDQDYQEVYRNKASEHKYYDNKWYGYRKPTEDNAQDEYD